MTDYRECEIPNIDTELPEEQVIITPNILSFEDTKVWYQSQIKKFTITNVGSGDFFFKRMDYKTEDFYINTSDIPMGLKSGQSASVYVTFKPESEGSKSVQFSITTLRGAVAQITIVGRGVSNESGTTGDSGDNDNDTDSSTFTGLKYFNEIYIEIPDIPGLAYAGLIPEDESNENISFVLKPKGNGSLVSSVTGEGRGKYTLDFQMNNLKATAVAMGDYSVILNGRENTTNGTYSFIGSGESNTQAGENAVLLSGLENTSIGDFTFIGSGNKNNLTGMFATILNSNNSTLEGNYSYIGTTYQSTGKGNAVFIGAGLTNYVEGQASAIVTGENNNLYNNYSFIGAGIHNYNGSLNSFIGCGNSNQVNTSENSFIGAGTLNKVADSPNGYVGAGNNNFVVNSKDSVIVSGTNNYVNFSANAFVGSGTDNIIYYADYSVIIAGDKNNISNGANGNSLSQYIGTGTENTLDSAAYSVILNGIKNSIKLCRESTIITGENNKIEGNGDQYGDVITGGVKNEIINSYVSSIDGGSHNQINESKNVSISSGYENVIGSSNNSFIANGFANNMDNSNYSGIMGGSRNRVYGNSSLIFGGYRNRISSNYNTCLGGSWGTDLGIQNHQFRAVKDGILWDQDSLENPGFDAEYIFDWTNNNPIFQVGEVILQKIEDVTQGTYEGTVDNKQYLYTHSKKYKKNNIWYDLPDVSQYNSIVIPASTCLFWELSVNLIDFTNASGMKILNKHGMIMNNGTELKIINTHVTECISNNEDLNNCNITVELDNDNKMVRFLLPYKVKDFKGGAVLKYTLATQDSIDFYWNN